MFGMQLFDITLSPHACVCICVHIHQSSSDDDTVSSVSQEPGSRSRRGSGVSCSYGPELHHVVDDLVF